MSNIVGAQLLDQLMLTRVDQVVDTYPLILQYTTKHATRAPSADVAYHRGVLHILQPAKACVSPSRVPFGVSRHVSKLYWIPSQDSPPHVFSPSAPCGAVRLVRLPLFSHLNLSSHSLEPPVSLRFPLFLSARSLSALLSNLIC